MKNPLAAFMIFLIALSVIIFSSCNTQPEYSDITNHEPPQEEANYTLNEDIESGEDGYSYLVGEITGRLGFTEYTFTMDYRMFFGDNTTFNMDVAIASLLICSGAPRVTLGLLETMGFTNINVENIGVIDNDQHRAAFGYRRVMYNGITRDIMIIHTTAAYGLAGWISNYDIGADIPEYFELTGSDHHEWTNHEHHKGYDVTANRIIAAAKDYIYTHQLSDDLIIWTMGLSRGGGLASLIGAYFERETNAKTFVYPIANPAITTSASAKEYQTIFNIINENDMTPLLPPAAWGFTRLGTDISGSIAPYLLEEFRAFNGTHYTYYQNLDFVIGMFVNQIAPNREALYVFDDNVYFASEYFLDRGEAEDEEIRLKSPFTPEMMQFVRFDIREELSGGYRVIIYQSPAFATQILAAISAGEARAVQNISIAEQFIEPIEVISNAFTASIRHSHGIATHYIIIRQ